MHADKFELNVLLTSRDRTILTSKAIDSLYENSKIFENINIYLYDNYSNMDSERMSLIQRLISDKKICHYSYSNEISTGNVFPKMFAHTLWTTHMSTIHHIRSRKGKNLGVNEYFLIMDNDMIVGPKWDQYFVSCIQDIEVKYPNIKFTMPLPSGINPAKQKELQKVDVINIFNSKKTATYGLSNCAGGSGFWFMTFNMLSSMNLNNEDVLSTYNRFKHHDSTIWNRIKKDNGNLNYCAAIIHKTDPYVLHLGGIVGSLCNNLTNFTYSEIKKKELMCNEERFKDMTINEIFEEFKGECSSW